MSEVKHTPGPWRYEPQNGSPTTGQHMISGSKPGYLAEVRDCGSGDVVANARLIAAAPELLEAAIELKDVCNRPSAARTRAEAWRKLDKAIAKALQPNAPSSAAPQAVGWNERLEL